MKVKISLRLCRFRISAKDENPYFQRSASAYLCKEPEILIFKLAGYEHFRESPETPNLSEQDTNILAKAQRYRSSASRIRTFSRKRYRSSASTIRTFSKKLDLQPISIQTSRQKWAQALLWWTWTSPVLQWARLPAGQPAHNTTLNGQIRSVLFPLMQAEAKSKVHDWGIKTLV